jgi:hypothetical protein
LSEPAIATSELLRQANLSRPDIIVVVHQTPLFHQIGMPAQALSGVTIGLKGGSKVQVAGLVAEPYQPVVQSGFERGLSIGGIVKAVVDIRYGQDIIVEVYRHVRGNALQRPHIVSRESLVTSWHTELGQLAVENQLGVYRHKSTLIRIVALFVLVDFQRYALMYR